MQHAAGEQTGTASNLFLISMQYLLKSHLIPHNTMKVLSLLQYGIFMHTQQYPEKQIW